MDLSRLKEPFPFDDIEWRKGQGGSGLLAYVTARAIFDRLDDVCGAGGWQTLFSGGPNGGVIAGIGINCDGVWVWKWDGADNTRIEAVKGGLSGAIKRAGSQWGIGRYLYNLPKTSSKKLPAWALPGGSGKPGKKARPAKPAGDREPKKESSKPKVASAATIAPILEAFVNYGAFQVHVEKLIGKSLDAVVESDIEYMRKEYKALKSMNKGDREQRIYEWGGA